MQSNELFRGVTAGKVGTACYAVRAAFSGAMRAFYHRGLQAFRPLYAAGDAAARHPYQVKLIRCLIAACVMAGGLAVDRSARAEEAPSGTGASIPFVVFEEKGSTNNHYVPSGWMGNIKGIRMDEGCTVNPHGGKTCLRFEYAEPGEWAGVVWQDPPNDWGDQPGGWNLTGARKLKFWARGDKGGESVSFKFGVLGLDKKFSDSSIGTTGPIKLTKDWLEYRIDLAGKDLTRIKTGFVWALDGQGSPVVFFLDDIRFE